MNALPRVLFVDDELSVLSGLRDVLRRDRHRWELAFVHSAAEALEEMDRTPVAVVVTDIRMPGMDGIDLLEEVHQRHPDVSRLALSGQADQDAMLRSLALVQQFLVKPSPPDQLRAAIERAVALRALLRGEGLRRAVGHVERLPAEPTTYLALTRALSRAGTNMQELADLIEQDPVMAVRILQLVNSAWFGSSRPVSTVREAVMRVGVDLLRGLALASDAFGAIEPRRLGLLSLHELQRLSFRSAQLARRVCGKPEVCETAFAASVVRDVGRLVLAIDQPDLAARLAARMSCPDHPTLDEAERELLGVDHAQVAGSLMHSWGLPLSLVEAVTFHHAPSRTVPGGDPSVLAAVHLADALLPSTCAGEPELPEERRLDEAFLARAGLLDEVARCRALAAGDLGRLHGDPS